MTGKGKTWPHGTDVIDICCLAVNVVLDPSTVISPTFLYTHLGERGAQVAVAKRWSLFGAS